jgi:hypothetical protein
LLAVCLHEPPSFALSSSRKSDSASAGGTVSDAKPPPAEPPQGLAPSDAPPGFGSASREITISRPETATPEPETETSEPKTAEVAISIGEVAISVGEVAISVGEVGAKPSGEIGEFTISDEIAASEAVRSGVTS